MAKFSHFGPEVSFSHALSRAFTNDEHIIIKHLATGSSINQWLSGSRLFDGLLRQRGFVKVSTLANKIMDKKVDAVI